jgi:hypothetical protein
VALRECTHPGSLAAGAQLPALTLAGTIPSQDATGIVTLAARVSGPGDSDTQNNDLQAHVGVGGILTDLAPVLIAQGPWRNGEAPTHIVRVRNTGTVAASGQIRVDFNVPFAIASTSGLGWNCTENTCTHPGPLASGAALPDIVIQSASPASNNFTDISASATVTSADDDLTINNNVAATSAFGGPNVDLATTVSVQRPWRAGEHAAFTTMVANTGPSPAPGPVSVQLNAPAGSVASGPGWTCTTVLACSHAGPVAAGATLPALTTLGTTPVQDGLGSIAVSASLVAGSGDVFEANNSAAASTGVGGPVVDLVATVRALGRWRVGGEATYIAQIANAGSQPSTGEIVATLDAPFPGAVATGSGWTCTSTLRCQYDTDIPDGGAAADLNVSFPIPDTASASSVSAGVSVVNASDRYTPNSSATLVGGIEAPAVTRTAALFDAEATVRQLPRGGRTTVRVQLGTDVQPESGRLTARLPQGQTVVAGVTGAGLLNMQSQPAGTDTLVTWDLAAAAQDADRFFVVAADADAPLGPAGIELELESELTAVAERDDAPLEIVAPRILSFAPATLGRASSETLELTGSGLDDAHTFELRAGTIHVSAAQSTGTATRRTLVFDTRALPLGSAQLVVLSGAVVLETASPELQLQDPVYEDPQVTVTGPPAVRINTDAFFYVSVHNPSNADITEVPVVISTPGSVNLRPEAAGGREIQADALADMASPETPAAVRLTASEVSELQAELPAQPPVRTDPVSGRHQVAVVIPRIPAGGSAQVKIAARPTAQVLGAVSAAVPINRTLFASSGNVSNYSRATAAKLVSGKIPADVDCSGEYAEACAYADRYARNIDNGRRIGQKYGCISFAALTRGFGGADCSFDPIGPLKKLIKKKIPGLGFFETIKGAFDLYDDLKDAADEAAGKDDDVRFGVASVDPNDKLSPAGFGTGRFVSGDDPLQYTIRFENLRTASAPAQRVAISDPLPAGLDASSVRFVTAEIGGVPVPLTGALSSTETLATGSAMLDAQTGRDVLLSGRVDIPARTLTVEFQGSPHIDDPFAPTPFGDFLPPLARSPTPRASSSTHTPGDRPSTPRPRSTDSIARPRR